MSGSPHPLLARPVADPSAFYRLRDGIYAGELFIAALTGLDLFSRLADRPLSRAELCRVLSIQDRPAGVLVTLLEAMGLLERHGDLHGLTATAREYLVRGSRWWIGPYYDSVADRPMVRTALEVLRTGRPARFAQRDEEWERAMGGEEFARRFTGEMDCRGLYLGPLLAERLDLPQGARLLDIGGGSGVYSACLAARRPDLRAAVLEKAPVDSIARRLLAERGLQDRVEVLAGDMFAALPEGFQAHLYSNVLHDWSEPGVRQLLGLSFRALPRGGTVAVHDAHLFGERPGPLAVAEYSVLLMLFTEGRCYSVPEMKTFLAEAGFRGVEHRELDLGRSLLTARKP